MSSPYQSNEEHLVKPEETKSNANEETKRPIDEFTGSIRELAQKLPESIGKLPNSIGNAIQNVLATRDHSVNVRISEETSKALDHLVEAGLFESRSEAAAFLMNEGIKAQTALFEQVTEKIEKIAQLRAELKSMVSKD